LNTNAEEAVEAYKFEQEAKEPKIEDSDHAPVTKEGLCGVFRYRSMDREIINYNEHKDAEGEAAFLKDLMVAFPFQAFDQEKKLQIEFRQTGNLENVFYTEKIDGKQKGQFFFFDLPLQKINEWKKANHPALKNLTSSKIVLSFDSDVSIYNAVESNGVATGIKEYALSSDPQDQAFLTHVSGMLLNRCIQKYLLFEHRINKYLSDEAKWGKVETTSFLEKNFNEFPTDVVEDELEVKIIQKLEGIYEPDAPLER
jgi:hypothetical protein